MALFQAISQADAPTASPPQARPGLDLHDSESAVF
jgi:hypothetical protein